MGDNADMAMIEFVDFNELYTKLDKPKKSTRRGRSKSKKKMKKFRMLMLSPLKLNQMTIIKILP